MANYSKKKLHWEGPDQLTVESGGTVVFKSGSTLNDSALARATGFIHLPLERWRGIATNEIPAKAIASGGSGVLGKDTTPILERISTSTDKALRLDWATSDVTEIAQEIVLPPDFPATGATVTVKLLVYKGSNTDTTLAVAVGYWEGKGGSNLGGNTGAITATTTPAVASFAVTTAITYPGVVNLTLTPGTHGNDALYLLGSWLEYARKTT